MAKKVSKVEQAATNAGVNMSKEPKNVTVNRPKGQVLQSAASFWNFEQDPEFTGTPLGSEIHDPKDGRVIGYDFVDQQGEPWVIGAAHAITKALETEIPGEDNKPVKVLNSERTLYIKWAGKIDMKDSGRTFNKYEVILLAK
jgi:hypothetical protein